MVQHSSTRPARVDLLFFFFFYFFFSFLFGLSSAIDHFGIIPELKEACIKAVPRSYITWQHAKCSPDRVAYATHTVDWLIRPCQTERQIPQKLDRESINWKSRTNKTKTMDQAFAQASLPGGGGERGLPSFAPLVTSSAPQSTFVSFCHSVRPFPIPPLKSSGSKWAGTLRHFHLVSPSSNDSHLVYID